MRIYNIAFFISLFFILGVGVASLSLNFFLAAAVVTLVWFVKDGRFFWGGVVLFSLFFGSFYYHFYHSADQQKFPLNEKITFEAVVSEDPKSGLLDQQLDVTLQNPYRGEVRLYIPLYPNYSYGEVLIVTGKIIESASGRLYYLNRPLIEDTGLNRGGYLKLKLFSFKESLVAKIFQVFPQEKAAFLSGLLFGERTEFSDSFIASLKNSGTTHLVALSGYNISIITISLGSILVYFVKRRTAFLLSILFVIAFVVMTGAEESVVRAAIMGMVFLISQQSSRLYSIRNAITLTAAIMLLFNPDLLIFNVGFQLSFAALMGMVYIQPLLKRFLEKLLKVEIKKGFLNWQENTLQTISAQLAAFPIIISTFGYFSPWSLLANVLILGLMPITMSLGFVTVALGLISYHLSLLAAWITGLFLGYEIFIINLFGSISS